MTQWALLFLSSFVFVFFKAFQQLNVVNDRRLWIVPTSMVMALTEVTVVITTVATGYSAVLPIGVGGGCGCLLAMSVNRRMYA